MKRKLSRVYSVICILALLVTSVSCILYGSAFAESSESDMTLYPSADASVRDGSYSNTNYGTAIQIEVKDDVTSGNNRRGFIKFDLTPADENIEKATLRLFAGVIGGDESRTVNIYGYNHPETPDGTNNEDWTETGIKWSNAPEHAVPVSSFTVINPVPGATYRHGENGHEGIWYEIDVTDYVKSHLNDGIVSFNLKIEGKSFASHVNFYSKENTIAQPELVMNTVSGSEPSPDPDSDPNKSLFNPVEDTFVAGSNNMNPNPFHALERLEARHNFDGTLIRRSYIKFEFSDFEKNVQAAKLRLYATTIGATASRTVEIGGVADTWSAETATWSASGTAVPSAKNASTFIANLVIENPTPGTQWNSADNGLWYEVDVTDFIKSQSDKVVSFAVWIRDTSPNGTAPDNQVFFNSSESQIGKPELIIIPQTDKFECEALGKSVSEGVTEASVSDALCSNGSVNIAAMTKVGDYIEYSLVVPEAGLYSVRVNNKNDSDRGIYQLTVDGTVQGSPIDQYNSTVSYTESDLGLIIFQEAGPKIFRFELVGQNPESQGFNLGLDYISIPKAQLEKAANVTSNPQPGLLETATEVALSTETSNADIYYKIDDATEWTLYTAPLNITKRTTITAYAKKHLMIDSDPVILVYSFPVDTDVQIQKTSSPITLDGTVDMDDPSGEWAGAELLEIAGAADGTGIHSADIYFKYDYEMLYLGAKIKDPTPMINSQGGTMIWNGDCLELFIGDEDLDYTQYPDKTSTMILSDIQIVISGGTGNGYQYYFYTNGYSSYPAMLMEIKKDTDGKGYTIEAAIPLSALGYEKPWEGEGKELIMNAVLNDGGSPGRGQWGWTTNNEQTKKSRGLWGKVAFEPAPAPAEELSLTAAVNNSTRIVTVTGQTFHIKNEDVAMIITNPSGEICEFGQVKSDDNGYFTFTGKINAFESGNGTYKVTVGGTCIAVPVSTEFEYTYTYLPSDDAALESLSIGNGILVPSFSTDRNIYIALVDKNAESFHITAEARDENYNKMTVNGAEVQSGSPYVTSVKNKFNHLILEVTAEDGRTTERYLVVAIKTNLKVAGLITKQIDKFLDKFSSRYWDIILKPAEFLQQIEKAFKF